MIDVTVANQMIHMTGYLFVEDDVDVCVMSLVVTLFGLLGYDDQYKFFSTAFG